MSPATIEVHFEKMQAIAQMLHETAEKIHRLSDNEGREAVLVFPENAKCLAAFLLKEPKIP